MVVGLLMIALVIVFFWVCLRLSLVVPVAAVESNLGVERSWELMKGNSLRMLAAILLTMIPFSIAFQAVAAAILGVQELTPLPTYDPKNANAFVAALADRGIEQLEFMQARFPAIVALSTVSGLLSQGLWAGLLGYAYRAATNMNQPAE
jgi:membrane-anchored glycerophosphoryl diester phosphodiesterase (GDPDase)